MSVYNIDTDVTEEEINGEFKPVNGSVSIDYVHYLNEYNEQYARLIAPVVNAVVALHKGGHMPSCLTIANEADSIITRMLKKRDEAIDSQVRDLNLVWDSETPDI